MGGQVGSRDPTNTKRAEARLYVPSDRNNSTESDSLHRQSFERFDGGTHGGVFIGIVEVTYRAWRELTQGHRSRRRTVVVADTHAEALFDEMHDDVVDRPRALARDRLDPLGNIDLDSTQYKVRHGSTRDRKFAIICHQQQFETATQVRFRAVRATNYDRLSVARARKMQAISADRPIRAVPT